MTENVRNKPQIQTSILIRHSPFAGVSGKEALDLALVCAAFEQKVNLIFADAGLLFLNKSLDPEACGAKNFAQLVTGLEFYDIENLLAERESLVEQGLSEAELLDATTLISRRELNQLSRSSQHLVSL